MKLKTKRHNLTLIEIIRDDNHRKFICRCDCGKHTTIAPNKFGRTKSCGCFKNKRGETNHCFTGYKEIYGRQWWQLKKNAKIRNIGFDLDIEDVWDLYLQQNRKCALTQLDIYFGPKNWTASIDRIDNKKHYIINNIQIVHKDINKIKMDLSTDYFIELCCLVAKKYIE